MAETPPPTPNDPTTPGQQPATPPPTGEGGTPPPAQPIDYAPAGGGAGYLGPPPDNDARTMGMLCHLLALFLGFLGPLIIWLIKRESHPFVDDQGKEALNFQITILIASIVAGLSCFILIGVLLVPLVALAHLVFCIIATIQANKGVAYRYPINIRFIK